MNKEKYKKYLNSEHWKHLRNLLAHQFHYTCQRCGEQIKHGHVHHFNYDNLYKEVIGKDVTYRCEECHFEKDHGEEPVDEDYGDWPTNNVELVRFLIFDTIEPFKIKNSQIISWLIEQRGNVMEAASSYLLLLKENGNRKKLIAVNKLMGLYNDNCVWGKMDVCKTYYEQESSSNKVTCCVSCIPNTNKQFPCEMEQQQCNG